MQRMPLVLLLSFFIVGSVAQSQSVDVVPPPSVDESINPQSMDVATPEQMGDADPLDVLEPKKETTPIEPTVPQFTEIPDPDTKTTTEIPTPETPAPEVKADVTPELAPDPAPADPPPAKKAAKKKKEKAPVVINNDPDSRREARFHRIYKKFNEQPTSEEAWEKASGSRKAEVYKVQKGDTLWALSNTFFADTNYWPKIWSLNVDKIGNPHEIDSSMGIQFFPGTMVDAPTLGLVEKEASEISQAPLLASNSNVPQPLPKEKKRAPILKMIPSSIPAYRHEPVQPAATLVDLPSLEKRFLSSTETMGYYVANQSPEALGKITETEMGMNTATDYQYIIVKLESPMAGAKRLVAVKELNKLSDPDSFFRSAHLIEVQGEIEIIEKVHDSRDLYRAMVTRTLQPIEVGAKLVAGPLPTFDPGPTALVDGTSGLIIGGEYENKRIQFQSNMIVFVNVGSAQGLREGQSLPVYSDIRKRNPGSAARINDRRVGTIKLIRVADSFSTAYVTSAQDDIFVGDHIGNRNNSSAGAEIEQNTDLTSSLESDLAAPIEDVEGDTSTDSSDFEL